MKSVFVQFRQPFASAPRVVCAPVFPQAHHAHNDSFVVTVREALLHGFTLNIISI